MAGACFSCVPRASRAAASACTSLCLSLGFAQGSLVHVSFIDASISIRRTSYEYQHQLVVTRTYQEGEEQLLEENAESALHIEATVTCQS